MPWNPAGAKRRRRIPRSLQHRRTTGFYDDSLTLAEQVALSQARDIQGLDEEIALLRVRLRSLAEDPKKLTPFLKGLEMLVKALAATHRLSKKSQDDLMDSVMGVLEGVGTAVLGEPRDG